MTCTIFNVGDKVSGTYYGGTFTGTVVYARPHTLNASYKHHIKINADLIYQRDAMRPAGDVIVVSTDSQHATLAKAEG